MRSAAPHRRVLSCNLSSHLQKKTDNTRRERGGRGISFYHQLENSFGAIFMAYFQFGATAGCTSSFEERLGECAAERRGRALTLHPPALLSSSAPHFLVTQAKTKRADCRLHLFLFLFFLLTWHVIVFFLKYISYYLYVIFIFLVFVQNFAQ